MREGQFIKQNKERWDSYQEPTDDPDEMAKRFTYLVDDLGYAKTHYPFSKITKYVNGIAAGIYLSIYKNKKEKSHRFITFFKTELPLILYRNRKVLRFALLFFVAFMIIGIFSAWQDPRFVRSVLGDGYVNMTEDNIAKGDPFGVYKSENEFVMFLSIAWNNIRVTLMCFTLGITCSVGTLWFMFNNGLMLGVFEQMFFAHDLGTKSVLVVFIHGTLEISAIILAGGAGMVMGNSILFPGTYSRLISFKRGAKEGIKILISLIPVLIVAATFEGYVTRHTEMPIWLSISILACSLAFILWYFVFYPVKINKQQTVA
ncbi:stage II sporulation protein M [Taibaiella lutea]|uniref:Stage II sporulation protein M n=1 Tax=Taibaiella lutea TaxID=2608001 RepID=A0A5M6CE26_9BACT|nr:stage II sporulation protein M [Taibaiella lutea]KAA5532710.1 stage II sporulation protein M [Taibaiella lutea]